MAQIWRPDTCGCVIEVTHEWALVRIVRTCPAHDGIVGADLFDVVLNGENRRRSAIYRELVINDALGLSKTTRDGGRDLSPDVVFEASFEGTGRDRRLVYSVAGHGVDDAKIAAVRSAVDAKLGVGRASFRGRP